MVQGHSPSAVCQYIDYMIHPYMCHTYNPDGKGLRVTSTDTHEWWSVIGLKVLGPIAHCHLPFALTEHRLRDSK